MEITVQAAARVLGLQVGQRTTFELTPMIRGLIDGGKLVEVEACGEDAGDEPGAGVEDPAAEAASRAKHPAGRALGGGG